jgi:hypothetical protein
MEASRAAASTQFFDLGSLQFHFLGLIQEAGKTHRQKSLRWIEEYRRFETQTTTCARARKLFPESRIRVLQNKSRIPSFMPAPHHLSIRAAPAGSVNKLDALV